jgi:signal transduction histidine kinase
MSVHSLKQAFKIPWIYQVLLGELNKLEVFWALRPLWVFLLILWAYAETRLPVQMFEKGHLERFWTALGVWTMLSWVLLLLSLRGSRKSPLRFKETSGFEPEFMKWSLVGVDACVLGLLTGITGLSYSLAVLPLALFVVGLIFLWPVKVAAVAMLVVAGCAWMGSSVSWVPLGHPTLQWQWGFGGLIVIGAFSKFLAVNLARYGSQAIEDRRYQQWLEVINTAVFDRMPAGALVCDRAGGILLSNPLMREYLKGSSSSRASMFDLLPTDAPRVQLHPQHPQELEVQLTKPGSTGSQLFQVQISPLTSEWEAIPQLYLVMFYDMTQRQKRQEQAELQRKWTSFKSLSAGLVHEIRNPLGAILGVMESLAENQQFKPEERQRLLEMIKYEGERLNRLIQDFLDSLGDTLVLQVSKVDVVELLNRFNQLVSQDPLVKEHHIHVTFNNRLPDRPTLEADEDRLMQVLHNLFQNAVASVIKSGRKEEGIEIDLEASPDRGVLIRFTDYGTGIPPDIVPMIFDPFFTTKPKGTGLGLAIAYRVIEAHKGRIQVSSVPHRFTKVEVELPA